MKSYLKGVLFIEVLLVLAGFAVYMTSLPPADPEWTELSLKTEPFVADTSSFDYSFFGFRPFNNSPMFGSLESKSMPLNMTVNNEWKLAKIVFTYELVLEDDKSQVNLRKFAYLLTSVSIFDKRDKLIKEIFSEQEKDFYEVWLPRFRELIAQISEVEQGSKTPTKVS